MSTLNPRASNSRRATVSVDPPNAAEAPAIRWSLSRSALRAARTSAFQLPPVDSRGPDLELCWTIDFIAQRAEAILIDPSSGSRTLLLQSESIAYMPEGDLVHIEVRAGNTELFACTVRPGDGRVLYATTTILQSLGLRGGRYEADQIIRP